MIEIKILKYSVLRLLFIDRNFTFFIIQIANKYEGFTNIYVYKYLKVFTTIFLF